MMMMREEQTMKCKDVKEWITTISFQSEDNDTNAELQLRRLHYMLATWHEHHKGSSILDFCETYNLDTEEICIGKIDRVSGITMVFYDTEFSINITGINSPLIQTFNLLAKRQCKDIKVHYTTRCPQTGEFYSSSEVNKDLYYMNVNLDSSNPDDREFMQRNKIIRDDKPQNVYYIRINRILNDDQIAMQMRHITGDESITFDSIPKQLLYSFVTKCTIIPTDEFNPIDDEIVQRPIVYCSSDWECL